MRATPHAAGLSRPQNCLNTPWALVLGLCPSVLSAQPLTPAPGPTPAPALSPVTLTQNSEVSIPPTVPPEGDATATALTSANPPEVLSASQRQALGRYEQGRGHYAAGRYRIAAAELEAALTLDSQGTNLLYNLGTVYERLGDIPKAINAYQRYLDAQSDPSERARILRVLTRLRGAREEFIALRRVRGRADVLFFVTAASAIASASVGFAWLLTDPQRDSLRPVLGFTLGGASLGALAAILYFARDASPRAIVYPSLSASQNQAFFTLSGTF